MPNSDLTLGLDPDDFGTTGLTLGMLIGIAHNEPARAVPRGYVRAQGPETMHNWRIRAVEKVLRDHGVDLDALITRPKVIEGGEQS